ncbi:MAG: T9SS type A sorting domain-containing protein, partial [Ignavibacteria bacterium]|nr:T9SS type A sorting domain-containing protein [Ignavibacteria bacterium]
GNSNSPKEYGFTDNLLTVGSYLYRLKMINSDGTFEYSEFIEVDVKQPDKIALNQNYPNPFNPVTKIKYQIPNYTSLVTLKVYDILGNEVATLVNEEKEPGYYQIEFDASTYRLSSGVYFYRLQAGENSFVKKLILTK